MGQTLKKLVPAGNEETKNKEMSALIDTYYSENVEKKTYRKISENDPNQVPADFYRAICEFVEKMNQQRGYTQFRVPKEDKLKEAFKKHKNGNTLKKEEFEKILEEVIVGTGLTGVGAKDTLIYIFGVPLTALFLKQSLTPHSSIPNEYFLPGITSATVFILAKLNKL